MIISSFISEQNPYSTRTSTKWGFCLNYVVVLLISRENGQSVGSKRRKFFDTSFVRERLFKVSKIRF